MKKVFSVLSVIFIAVLFDGCVSLGRPHKTISRKLVASGVMTQKELFDFFMQENPSADEEEVLNISALYIKEASDEGINSDVAFVQMCLETGFLKFGGLVTPDMHNYCGLGSIDPSQTGAVFETMELGVRAHIQHLQAYATTQEVELVHELVDPRYSWVHKMYLIEDITGLAGKWATDPLYSLKLETLLSRLETM